MTDENLIDQVFLKKLNNILEENYSNEHFGVKELTESSGISHSQLHRKLHAIYGKSASQFIREFRLQKAIKMLQDDIVTASEISYKVGFSSPTYFNTSFREYYGYPPGEAKYKASISLGKSEDVDTFEPKNTASKKKILVLSTIGILLVIALSYYFYTDSSGNTLFSEKIETKKSIAVLPFKDMSPEDTQWFGDGVAESILTDLSRLNELTVISRTSSDTYKKTDKKIPEIAKELGVSYIIEGSVTMYNNEVKITIQLINANDEHIWSKEYHENFEDIFIIQRNVAKQIADHLKINLSPEEERALNSFPTNNHEAYQLYLKGRAIADTRIPEDLEKSIVFYEQAIFRDSNYAICYAEIANSKFLLTRYAGKSLDETIAESKILIEKALAIDSNAVRAYSTLGHMGLFERNWEKAAVNFKKAIEINPNDATSHHHYAVYFRDKPTLDVNNWLFHINIAQRLDPFSNPINAVKLDALIASNKIAEAQIFYNKISFIFGERQQLDYEIALKSLLKKDWSEAIRLLEKEVEINPNNPMFHERLGLGYMNIINDRINGLRHLMIAYDLDSSDIEILDSYFYGLLYNKKFEEANELLNSKNFIELYNNFYRTRRIIDYHSYIGDYKKTLEYVENLKIDEYYYFSKAWVSAITGDIENTYKALKFIDLRRSKAMVFANLKERDSMYYYLNTLKRFDIITSLNGLPEFDPYRNEERYQEHLKKNYLPSVN
jgi:TolB-like protein/AraC-like DNA-binding protein/Tfp pilus assembly protein PilF